MRAFKICYLPIGFRSGRLSTKTVTLVPFRQNKELLNIPNYPSEPQPYITQLRSSKHPHQASPTCIAQYVLHLQIIVFTDNKKHANDFEIVEVTTRKFIIYLGWLYELKRFYLY